MKTSIIVTTTGLVVGLLALVVFPAQTAGGQILIVLLCLGVTAGVAAGYAALFRKPAGAGKDVK
jgi:hypothetical protein